MSATAKVLRAVLTAVIVVGLVVWSFLDLDTAAKVGGVIACLLALPAIWLLPQSRPSTATPRIQRLSRVRSGGSIKQKSVSPAEQRVVRAEADGDIEQSQ
jgi:hypothetical protein